MNNTVGITRENLTENKRFTTIIVIIILIVAIVSTLLVKFSRDSQIEAIKKELSIDSQNSTLSSIETSSGESKIERLLRISKVVTKVGSDLKDLNLEAKVNFTPTDTGLKIDQTL